ncbi:MAG: hypothetical protein AAFY56_13045 [Pseudomonadota bacterium]
MSFWERLVGLIYTATAGGVLYYFWPDIQAQLGGTWFADLTWIVAVVYVFAACWALEIIWSRGLGSLVAKEKRATH